MADRTTVVNQTLQEAAGKIRQAQTSLEEVIGAMSSAVSALESGWQGDSHNAFVEVWEESRPAMEKLAEAIGKFAPELESVIKRQEETEATNVGAIKGLAFQ